MKSARVLRLEVARKSKVVRIDFPDDDMTTKYYFADGSTYTHMDASSETFKREAEALYKRADELQAASDKLFRMGKIHPL